MLRGDDGGFLPVLKSATGRDLPIGPMSAFGVKSMTALGRREWLQGVVLRPLTIKPLAFGLDGRGPARSGSSNLTRRYAVTEEECLPEIEGVSNPSRASSACGAAP
jgi:hypothetical protein